MNFQFYAKNLTVTEILKEYLDIRLSSLERIDVPILSCRADLSRDEHHKKGDVFRVEINLEVKGALLRVVEKHFDVRAAIDLCAEKLMRQLRKYKTKHLAKLRKGRRFLRTMKDTET